MNSKVNNEFVPDYQVTPGEVLEYELELRDMSKSELAKRTGLSEKHINAMVRGTGTCIITPETAIKLERALGMPMQYWLNLETQYQEARARLAEKVALESDLGWMKKIPVAEMAKLGWIEKHKNPAEQLGSILRFFGIASVSQWEELWPNIAVAYRQHNKYEVFPEAVSAWLRQGELQAAAIACDPFDRKLFRETLENLRALTVVVEADTFLPALANECAKAGVAVVCTPPLPKTGVSGATRWVSPDKAIIQLSFRYRTNDHFWFTFFHEAGHILLHGKKDLFLEGASGVSSAAEEEANSFAERMLFPQAAYNAFIKDAPYSREKIIRFAHEIGIAPGIVVGNLQHKGLLPMSHLNGLKVRYRWTN